MILIMDFGTVPAVWYFLFFHLIKYHLHDDFRDAILLPFIDAFTSIFAGCVIFATLGYTAAASDVEIGSVVKQGKFSMIKSIHIDLSPDM